MSSIGAAPRAAVPVSNARAEASRRNGAKSRGPRTPEGKARAARNALKHGLRAQKYVVLAEEDAGEFEGLEAAMVEELAPVGVLQNVLARRVAVAAWRIARADRIEAELFRERHVAGGGLGLAMIRDGNGSRSFETLLRYRGAAMAEFSRALRTLQALQAGQALEAAPARAAHPIRPAARPPLDPRRPPDEPGRAAARPLDDVLTEPRAQARALHEAAAPWLPNGPEPRQSRVVAPARPELAPNQPEPHRAGRPDHGRAMAAACPGGWVHAADRAPNVALHGGVLVDHAARPQQQQAGSTSSLDRL
jgi:hypothetical protein